MSELDPRLSKAVTAHSVIVATLNLIHSLKRKYGSTLADVIAFRDEVQGRLHELESHDRRVAGLHVGVGERAGIRAG